MLFRGLFGRFFSVDSTHGQFKHFQLSRQKTQKTTGAVITHASFLFVHSVSNICSVVANFPAKRLTEKIRCSKIRMRRFFFFYILCLYLTFYIFNKVYFYFLVVSMCQNCIYQKSRKHSIHNLCFFDKSFYLFQFSSKYKLIR